MTTEDITVPQDGSWLGIPSLGGSTIIFNNTNKILIVRLGVTSVSEGMRLRPEQTMMFDETIYVKYTLNDGTPSYGSLVVSR